MFQRQLDAHFEKRDIELILSALADYERANISNEALCKEIVNICSYLNEDLENYCEDCGCVLTKQNRVIKRSAKGYEHYFCNECRGGE